METQKKRESKTKKSQSKKIKKTELSQLEQEALDKWRRRDKERIGPLKFKKVADKTVSPSEENPEKFWPQMMETTGSPDFDFFQTIIGQVSNTLQKEDSKEVLNYTAAIMHGLKPQDETEGVLIAQMVGTHNLIMEFMKRAVLQGQYMEAGNDYTNRASRLMNIFIKQLETLQKYRGKSAQQKMVVEHVHIHEGGQAVVGQIDTKSRGDGDESKK